MRGPDHIVEREDSGTAGRYVIHLAGTDEAEMTYRRQGADTLIVDHTGTPPAYRGQGIAQLLVDRLIADARAEHFRIVPLCSYVAAQFRRHPEWADLLAG
jgi:predicted GNAT family acetyltransferase